MDKSRTWINYRDKIQFFLRGRKIRIFLGKIDYESKFDGIQFFLGKFKFSWNSIFPPADTLFYTRHCRIYLVVLSSVFGTVCMQCVNNVHYNKAKQTRVKIWFNLIWFDPFWSRVFMTFEASPLNHSKFQKDFDFKILLLIWYFTLFFLLAPQGQCYRCLCQEVCFVHSTRFLFVAIDR